MAAWHYTFATLLGIWLIGGSLALQILYIKNNQSSDDYYPHQIASVVIDTIVVAFLMGTLIYYRPYSSAVSTGVTVSLLMVGLGLEIFSTQWEQTQSTTVGGYFLATINSLIRLYIFVQTRCEKPLSTAFDITREIVETARKTGKPVADLAKEVAAPLATTDLDNILNRVRGLVDSLVSKTTLTDDEKREKRHKLLEIFGKEPREPREPKGGRR